MTTPERLKRRQMIEGTALLILGVFTIIITMYFRHQDMVQRACLAEQIHEIGNTIQVRSELVEAESRATRNVISSALTAKTRAQYDAARDVYFHDLGRIDAGRRHASIPAFPAGTCDT